MMRVSIILTFLNYVHARQLMVSLYFLIFLSSQALVLERSAGSQAADVATDAVLLAARRCVNVRELSLAGCQVWTDAETRTL